MEQGRIAVENDEKVDDIRVPVHVTIDGPFGGCTMDLGEYENVFLAAGGAGVTFTLGLLDDLVGRIVLVQRRSAIITIQSVFPVTYPGRGDTLTARPLHFVVIVMSGWFEMNQVRASWVRISFFIGLPLNS
jgi:hypothetical protein